jgi:glycosyltransferase involved in cell wall biosynthesis
MRVGFDARWYNDSGVGAYVQGLLRAMAAASPEFDLIVYANSSNAVPGLSDWGVEVVPVRCPRYSFAEQSELRLRAREDKLDLFHSPFFAAPLRLECPLVVTIHDLIPFRFRTHSRPKQAMIRMGYRLAAKRAQHIIADSENTGHDLYTVLGVPRERISVVHLAPAECFTSENARDNLAVMDEKYSVRPPFILASSARNWRTKNLETALDAISQAHGETGEAFQTVVYGPPQGISVLDAKIRWPALNLVHTGYIPAPDLAQLFRHARAFIMPSLYEGFGLPVVEAMACGCPVIASNAGSLPEVAGQGAQIFAPLDAKGMAAAISGLITNDANFEMWRAAALRRAADFSWERAARQTISVYHRIHDKNAAAASA